MQKFQKKSIGSVLFLEIHESENSEKIFSEISDFLDFFEAKFSRFLKNNWLFELNSRHTAILDEHSRTMIKYMQKIAKTSRGYFDPTVGKRLRELWYGNQEFFFSQEAFKHRDFDEIVTIENDTIFLQNGFELEFGGVWKWYLIDWIYDFLVKNLKNSHNFLINFWGDMKCRGEFRIALESPFSDNEAVGTVMLKNQSLACSAPTKRVFGKNSHHLIHPFSWQSSREVYATFLVCDAGKPHSAMMVDAWATVLSVMDFSLAKNFLENFSDISGMIIRENGEFFCSENANFQLFV